jgi:hypothetical protein
MPDSRDTRQPLARCQGINKDGSACKARAQRNSEYCLAHDPERVTDLTEWRRRGGRASSNAARARRQLPEGMLTNQELQGLVGKTIREVLDGTTEPGVARSVFDGARTYITVAEAGAFEELTRRLDELEALARRGGVA